MYLGLPTEVNGRVRIHPDHLTAYQGDTVKLVCNVDYDDFNIEWFKDGQILANNFHVRTTYHLSIIRL